MGVKLARALGAHVVAFTTSESKRADVLRLGAQEVVVSRNPEEMNAQAGKLDFILNTVAVPHSLDTYLALLGHGGTMALVGIPEKSHPSPSVASLIGLRRSLAGSLVGGIKETQFSLSAWFSLFCRLGLKMFRDRQSSLPAVPPLGSGCVQILPKLVALNTSVQRP
jgi:D-arabinose 1-dehydrogenase-like Zn-dependent alcohol dehydrogenase